MIKFPTQKDDFDYFGWYCLLLLTIGMLLISIPSAISTYPYVFPITAAYFIASFFCILILWTTRW